MSHIGFHAIDLLCNPLKVALIMSSATRGRNDVVYRSC